MRTGSESCPSLASLEPELAAAIYSLRVPQCVAQLPPSLEKLARQIDGARTVAQVCAEAGLSLTQGILAVTRLANLGIITLAERDEATDRDSAGFTSVEEAFFASEVQPIDECDEPFPRPSDRLGQALSRAFARLGERLPSLRLNHAG